MHFHKASKRLQMRLTNILQMRYNKAKGEKQMPHSLAALLTARHIPYFEHAPMAERTTLKVGGPAEYLVEARSAEDIIGALAAAAEAEAPVYVIGNGSNLLVRDAGIRGLVIVVGRAMASIEVSGNGLVAAAGAPLARVAQLAQAAGLTGMEALSGIPGTIGGAVCMNAGAYGAEMSQLVTQVQTVDPMAAGGAEMVTLTAADLGFGYRSSAVMRRGLIATQVSLTLAPKEPVAVAAMMRDFAGKRRDKQPLTLPSAGSFFKRPPGLFAGSLIEGAGLKGTSVGGAQVSEKHAGFLVNTGGATAQDFLDLMEHIQRRVLETNGVLLEPEVRILG